MFLLHLYGVFSYKVLLEWGSLVYRIPFTYESAECAKLVWNVLILVLVPQSCSGALRLPLSVLMLLTFLARKLLDLFLNLSDVRDLRISLLRAFGSLLIPSSSNKPPILVHLGKVSKQRPKPSLHPDQFLKDSIHDSSMTSTASLGRNGFMRKVMGEVQIFVEGYTQCALMQSSFDFPTSDLCH